MTSLYDADAMLIQSSCCTWIAVIEQVKEWQHNSDLSVILVLIWKGESIGCHLQAMQELCQSS